MPARFHLPCRGGILVLTVPTAALGQAGLPARAVLLPSPLPYTGQRTNSRKSPVRSGVNSSSTSEFETSLGYIRPYFFLKGGVRRKKD